jgi:hypothetical protein
MTWTKLHDLLACTPTPFTNAAIIKNARETPEAIVSVDDRGKQELEECWLRSHFIDIHVE